MNTPPMFRVDRRPFVVSFWIVCRLSVVAWAFCEAVPSAEAGTKEPPTAPGWSLQDTDGRTVHLSDFRGKVVILDFWATWCPPCRKEIPGLIELQKKYGPRGLVVIGVSLDEDFQAVLPFCQKAGVNYVVVSGTPLVASEYGEVSVIPTAFVINKEGKIIAIHEGLVETAAFEADLRPLF